MTTRAVARSFALLLITVLVVVGILARDVGQRHVSLPADGGHAISAPPPSLSLPAARQGRYENAVTHVWAKDLAGYDLSRPINAVAKKYRLSAAGLLATLESECGLFTHSTACDRVYPPYDVSFGDAQIIVSTAGQYGVGNGVYDGYYGANTTYVRNWENSPWNGIGLAARIYRDDRRITGARFPALHRAFNCGPGDMNPAPGTQCALNATAFQQWYDVALRYLKRR